MSRAALKVNNLAVAYRGTHGIVQAVQEVSLEVEPGQITAIVGESGSGKSTTASAIIGLLPGNAEVTAGSITLGDLDLTKLKGRAWRSVRGKRIALIPQDPNNSLNPVKTIGESVGEGLAIHGRISGAERKKRVIELLDRVGISEPERRYRQYPHELSGGMKQRCLIAAALALEPEFIIADEPTSALDVTVQRVILDLIDKMRKELGVGVLLITHDLAVAGDRANRVVVMQNGVVRETGYAAAVLDAPQHEYTKRLLSDVPSLNLNDVPKRVQRDTETLLTVDGFTQRFGDFTAAEDISFTVKRGTTHAIVGESGSGKTTTGRAIAGFSKPTAGQILLDGKPVRAHDRQLRKQIQLVYQNPYSSLDPRQTIAQIVGEPLRNFKLANKQQIAEKVSEYLQLVALDPQLANRRPAELSGGQRQRVAIARALILEPEVVVFDEAVSALDVTVQSQILRLLTRLQRERDITYVFISHDLAVVRQISDTVSVLQNGNQVESGLTERVFADPQHPFTKQLIAAIPGARFRDGMLNLGL